MSAETSRLKPDQKTIEIGVNKTANMLEIAVRVTERAISPRLIDVKKFDTFPPGQHATTIIPNATLGGGFKINVSSKVKRGKAIIWPNIPEKTKRGLFFNSLKCSTFNPNATLNIINPKNIVSIRWLVGSKINFISSNV